MTVAQRFSSGSRVTTPPSPSPSLGATIRLQTRRGPTHRAVSRATGVLLGRPDQPVSFPLGRPDQPVSYPLGRPDQPVSSLLGRPDQPVSFPLGRPD
jgi:hypothetical protein